MEKPLTQCRKCGAWMHVHPTHLCHAHRHLEAQRRQRAVYRQLSREDRLWRAARRAYDTNTDIQGDWS